MLVSDDIYEPTIIHESLQRPIYLTIHMKSRFRL
jgi:hypothetical protein